MDIPDFTGGVTLAKLQSDFVANYEAAYLARTGNTRIVQPAQAEMLLINSGSYMIYNQALRVQSAALMSLVPWATYPVLDSIAADYQLKRLLPQAATTTVTINLNPGHGALVIPAGLRIQSTDGLATFFISVPVIVTSGVDVYTAVIKCDTPGAFANGYAIGTINVILDPEAYLVSITNTDVTSGGSDIETDDGLRSRIYLAPGALSVAGPDDAYITLAKSASPLILDVKPNNGGGGLVNLCILVAGGVASSGLLTAVENVCDPKTKRPLSDTVTAINPTVINYTVQIDLTLYGSVADPTAATAAAQAAVQALVDGNGALLNIDTTLSQLTAAGSLPGTYNAVVNLPVADIIVGATEVGICTSVVVNLVGFNYEK